VNVTEIKYTLVFLQAPGGVYNYYVIKPVSWLPMDVIIAQLACSLNDVMIF
jgi:hypothetical protein